VYESEFRQVNFANVVSSTKVTKKALKSQGVIDAKDDPFHTVNLHSMLAICQSALKCFASVVADKTSFEFDFPKEVRCVWFMFLENCRFDRKDFADFFRTDNRHQLRTQFNKGEKSQDTGLTDDAPFNFSIIADTDQSPNAKTLPKVDAHMDQDFFSKSRKPAEHSAPSVRRTEWAFLPKTKFAKTKNEGVQTIIKAIVAQKDGLSSLAAASTYFDKLAVLEAFTFLRVEFVVTNFVKLLFSAYRSRANSHRSRLTQFAKDYAVLLLPECKSRIEVVFPIAKSLFFVYLFVHFYLNRERRVNRSIGEMARDFADNQLGMQESQMSFVQERLATLKGLLEFRFSAIEPLGESFRVSNSLVWSILLFALKRQALFFDFGFFQKALNRRNADQKELLNEISSGVTQFDCKLSERFLAGLDLPEIKRQLNRLQSMSRSHPNVDHCLQSLFSQVSKAFLIDAQKYERFRDHFHALSQLVRRCRPEEYPLVWLDYWFESRLFMVVFIASLVSCLAEDERLGCKILRRMTTPSQPNHNDVLDFKNTSPEALEKVGLETLKWQLKVARKGSVEEPKVCPANKTTSQHSPVTFGDALKQHFSKMSSLDFENQSSAFVLENFIFNKIKEKCQNDDDSVVFFRVLSLVLWCHWQGGLERGTVGLRGSFALTIVSSF
jgi:hypothetical protein